MAMKINYYKLAFILLFCFFLFSCAERKAKNSYKMAEELLKNNNYKEAVAKYVEVLKYDKPIPEVEDSYYKIGVIYSKYLDDPNSAIYYFEQMFTKFPKSSRIPEVKKDIAYTYLYKLNQPEKALTHLEYIEQNHKNYPQLDEVVYHKSKSLISLKKYDEAMKTVENFNTVFPNSKFNEEVDYQKGLIKFNQGRYKEAIENYNNYIQKYPNGSFKALAKFDIGVSQENLGNYKEALETFKSIGSEYPNQEALKIKIQKLEERLKKKSKAPVTRTPKSLKKSREQTKSSVKRTTKKSTKKTKSSKNSEN
ncbi:MAG: tetratricopeptide repeat protein [Proteobacteria bacterium]|nr:tetratricopeptide repeat protein [Pseudomonadota bacterium]